MCCSIQVLKSKSLTGTYNVVIYFDFVHSRTIEKIPSKR